MKPVVTVAEMRAIDDEAHWPRWPTTSWSTGPARPWPPPPCASWAAPTAAGWWWWPARAPTAPTAGWPPPGCAGAGRGSEVLEAADAPDRIARDGGVDLVIDAAYGTGFRGTYRAPSVPAGVRVLAVDIPSGVDGDTGEACGEPLRADVTVTFAALKPGLLQGDGPLLAGRVEVVDIGLDVDRARLWVVEDADVARLLPVRPRGAYKWQSAVAVVAGSPGMTGAAELCAHAAYRAGAGMVRLGVPGADPALLPAGEAVATELAAEGWADGRPRDGDPAATPSWSDRASVAAEDTGAQVRRLVAGATVPVVVDADGLVALGTGAGDRPTSSAAPRSAGPLPSSPPTTASSPA